MSDMRTKLDANLRDPSRPVEEQEKTIEILIELAGDDEPAWIYLESQHAHIVDTMRGIYNKAQEKCRGEQGSAPGYLILLMTAALKSCDESASTSTATVDALRRQLSSPTYSVDMLKGEYPVARGRRGILTAATPVDLAWIAVQSMVKQLSEYLTRCLPGFWRIAKACMDGKYRKVGRREGGQI
jgi:exocyst complex component 2